MRTFLIIWLGQTASLLGSRMTTFAITIWAWEQTGQATPLSLIIFFTEVPALIAAFFGGVLVDRFNRKHLMMLGDGVAALSALAILLLLVNNRLEIWHFYLTGAINGLFGSLQWLAYSASMSVIVPKQHYTRVSAMESLQGFGSGVIAPALAGALYVITGLLGILAIDLLSFLVAVSTLCFAHIPQPKPSQLGQPSTHNLWQELTFGFRYIFQRPSLVAIMLFVLTFSLFDTVSAFNVTAAPMILARTGNNAAILASVQAAIGLGGVLGALVLSLWGGPKRRIHGLLLGAALGFGGEMILGLGQVPVVWLTAGFFGAFFIPFYSSSYQAIWLAKVEPTVQGRVFAARSFLSQITAPLGYLIAGSLADSVFEPAMMPGGRLAPLLGNIFGAGTGSGMALQFSFFSLCAVLLSLSCYALPVVRDVEDHLPDHAEVI